METGYELKIEHPVKKANVLSKAFYGWLIPLIKKGTEKSLELGDIYENLDENQSDNLTVVLERYWEAELLKGKNNNGTPSLLRALLKTQYVALFLYGLLWGFVQLIIMIAKPIIMGQLLLSLQYIQERGTTECYIYAASLVIVSFFQVFFSRFLTSGLLEVGMRVRVALSSMIYRKILKLNQKVLAETSTGEIVNLLSNDLQRFDLVFMSIHAFWTMPIQLLIVIYIVNEYVGLSSLIGVAVIVGVTLPMHGCLAKLFIKYRKSIAQKTDRRIKSINEVISGIKVIKMYAWEKPFQRLVETLRDAEMKKLNGVLFLKGVFTNYILFIDKVGLCATLFCFVTLGYSINSAIVFSIAQCFFILLWSVSILLPSAINLTAETLVAIDRAQKILTQEEKSHKLEKVNSHNVALLNVHASWDNNGFTLTNIDLRVPEGCLCAIVGPVGAGKSSLLQLLLGELCSKSGSIQIGGTVSYSSQKPWIFFSTIRSNILFGQKYEKTWYDEVISICALDKDLKTFAKGDQTVVGEKGVILSGGQQARINLARAIYKRGDVFLLDDPLSAVDTHVGKHLFEECILRHLKGKTRFLVTHQLQYVKKADFIVVMNNGCIEAQGSLEELSHCKKDFTSLLTALSGVDGEEQEEAIHPEQAALLIDAHKNECKITEKYQIDQEKCENKNSTPLIDYLFRYSRIGWSISAVVMFFITQLFNVVLDLWITYWCSQEEIRNSFEKSEIIIHLHTTEYNTTITGSSLWHNIFEYVPENGEIKRILKTDFAIYFYLGLLVAFIFATFFRSYLYFKICILSSTNIHLKAFRSLLKAPMRFFDTNPSGRILNVVSKDMGTVDEYLPQIVFETAQVVLVIAGLVITIAISNPYMIITSTVMIIGFFRIKKLYTSIAKDLKHLEGIAKSPVFSHVNLTLLGITTIRASSAEELLIKEFDQHQNVHTSISHLLISCSTSFSLWIDLIVIAFLACVTFSSIVLSNLSHMSGSFVGLAVAQCLNLIGRFQFGIRQAGEVITSLSSVERILQYVKIDQEGPFETSSPEDKIMEYWPSRGTIVYKNVSLKYGENDPLVLKALNFSIKSGEKIGIAGRTGAGKSSLIAVLFRLTNLDGNIFIDGIDTKILGLTDLRKKISIIPQEPVLFTETLRYNLDPFREFEDDKIWDALEQVELKDAVQSLDLIVTEGGGNFSLGQRQLICLARAILKNNKILIMDEATANVDHRTDSLIQATIRRKFKDCTVITIAHRLNTIMDSDKVIVMSFGRIVEFDHPHKLLQIPGGYFLKMVLETGSSISHQLQSIAETAYLNYINTGK